MVWFCVMVWFFLACSVVFAAVEFLMVRRLEGFLIANKRQAEYDMAAAKAKVDELRRLLVASNDRLCECDCEIERLRAACRKASDEAARHIAEKQALRKKLHAEYLRHDHELGMAREETLRAKRRAEYLEGENANLLRSCEAYRDGLEVMKQDAARCRDRVAKIRELIDECEE